MFLDKELRRLARFTRLPEGGEPDENRFVDLLADVPLRSGENARLMISPSPLPCFTTAATRYITPTLAPHQTQLTANSTLALPCWPRRSLTLSSAD